MGRVDTDRGCLLLARKGIRETRGSRMQGTQVHSVRLLPYVISIDATFGMPGQKLILLHE